MDPRIATQVTVLTLTNAINQQQLNSIAARNQVGAIGTVLTLGVQLNHLAALNLICKPDPLEAASISNLMTAALPQQLATLQTGTVVPKGTK
jgi:hypothetical protein